MAKMYKISEVGGGTQGKRNWLCGVELVEVAVVGSSVLLFIAVDTERRSTVSRLQVRRQDR